MPPAEERAACKMRLLDCPCAVIPMSGDGIEILFHPGAPQLLCRIESRHRGLARRERRYRFTLL